MRKSIASLMQCVCVASSAMAWTMVVDSFEIGARTRMISRSGGMYANLFRRKRTRAKWSVAWRPICVASERGLGDERR